MILGVAWPGGSGRGLSGLGAARHGKGFFSQECAMKLTPDQTLAVELLRLTLTGYTDEEKRAVCEAAIKAGDWKRKAVKK